MGWHLWQDIFSLKQASSWIFSLWSPITQKYCMTLTTLLFEGKANATRSSLFCRNVSDELKGLWRWHQKVFPAAFPPHKHFLKEKKVTKYLRFCAVKCKWIQFWFRLKFRKLFFKLWFVFCFMQIIVGTPKIPFTKWHLVAILFNPYLAVVPFNNTT